MQKKRVLIVTYYWPPAGGSAIQRVLKFVKYMRQYGWEPVILTVRDGEYPAIDHTFEQEIPKGIKIYKTGSIQPFSLYRSLTGKKKHAKITNDVFTRKNKNIMDRIAKWIRLNLFIPDARIGWYFHAHRQASRIIREEKIDLIFSSSPPHSLQLIARKIARKHRIKWVADFRDPWSELVHYQANKRSWLTRKIDGHFEKIVFKDADRIIAAAKHYAQCIKSHVDRQIDVIYNGYDAADMLPATEKTDSCFLITYTGELSKDRIPYPLIKALSKLKNDRIRLQFIGNACEELHEEVLRNNIEGITTYKHYIPHKEALRELARSDLLLIVVNNTSEGRGIVPGKLFEYMGMRKPILCIGPETGETAHLIAGNGAGFTVDYPDEEKCSRIITELLHHQTASLTFTVDKFERQHETKQLCAIFDSLTNKPTSHA